MSNAVQLHENSQYPLPKINRLPRDWGEPHDGVAAPKAHTPVLVAPDKPASRRRWDPRFALLLIALVVAVNVTLAMLLGSPQSRRDEQQKDGMVQSHGADAPAAAESLHSFEPAAGETELPSRLPPPPVTASPVNEREKLLNIITQ